MNLARLVQWDSKAALCAHLGSTRSSTIVVGLAAEAPRLFYSATVGGIELGIHSSGLGPVPAVIALDAGHRAIVGHDTSLTWLDLAAERIAAEHRLDGAFYEVLPVDLENQVVVVHELGALRIDATGKILWNVDAPDVVEESRLDLRGNLVLSMTDQESPLIISLRDGQRPSTASVP